MMYVPAWDWFDDFHRAAKQSGDAMRKSLPETAYQAWRYQDANDFAMASKTFEAGATLARKLHERRWELFFEYWMAQGKLYHTREIQEALDLLMRLTVRAHQPEYADCDPIRAQIFFTMADAYFEVDVYSYVDEIWNLLDMVEREIPMEQDTHLRLMTLRSDLHYQFDEYDKALETAQHYLAQSEGHIYRQYSGYVDLRRLAYTRGDIAGALDYANQAHDYALKKESQLDEALSKLWQATHNKQLGNDTVAHELFRQGIDLFDRYDFVRWVSFYNAVCDYLEACGKKDEALKFRQEQVDNIKMSDGRLYECISHVQYCRLLGRMDKPLNAALIEAEVVCERLKKPHFYQKRLQRIRDGDYYEFAWQKEIAEKRND